MPVLATCLNILPLICCTPQFCIERYACACPPNLHVDGGCCCCGLPGCLVSPCGWPPGLGSAHAPHPAPRRPLWRPRARRPRRYFVDLFGNRIENYVHRMLGGARPRKVRAHIARPGRAPTRNPRAQVLVCMIYFPDVHGRGSWADCFLSALCYDCAPGRLQAMIRAVRPPPPAPAHRWRGASPVPRAGLRTRHVAHFHPRRPRGALRTLRAARRVATRRLRPACGAVRPGRAEDGVGTHGRYPRRRGRQRLCVVRAGRAAHLDDTEALMTERE